MAPAPGAFRLTAGYKSALRDARARARAERVTGGLRCGRPPKQIADRVGVEVRGSAARDRAAAEPPRATGRRRARDCHFT